MTMMVNDLRGEALDFSKRGQRMAEMCNDETEAHDDRTRAAIAAASMSVGWAVFTCAVAVCERLDSLIEIKEGEK